MEKYLPIGTVVLLKESNKRLMIYGRRQLQVGTNKEWDYIGCLYPEGNLDKEHCYLFNHDQIVSVYLVGFQDYEELLYQQKILKQ